VFFDTLDLPFIPAIDLKLPTLALIFSALNFVSCSIFLQSDICSPFEKKNTVEIYNKYGNFSINEIEEVLKNV
jgi:hypothetical protein